MHAHTLLTINGESADGYVVPVGECKLVFIKKGQALLACGAIDIEALDKFNVPAAKVTGVSTLDELLDGTVQRVNATATQQGAIAGQSGRSTLETLGASHKTV